MFTQWWINNFVWFHNVVNRNGNPNGHIRLKNSWRPEKNVGFMCHKQTISSHFWLAVGADGCIMHEWYWKDCWGAFNGKSHFRYFQFKPEQPSQFRDQYEDVKGNILSSCMYVLSLGLRSLYFAISTILIMSITSYVLNKLRCCCSPACTLWQGAIRFWTASLFEFFLLHCG